MTWTTDKPTVPGWYWWRMFRESPRSPHPLSLILEVYSQGDGLFIAGDSVNKFGGCHWCGPLTPPGEGA